MENIRYVIEGCIKMDGVCQHLFYNRFRGFAAKLVFRYIYRYEKAMDVVTDGFVKVFTHFPEFRLSGSDDPERLAMAWLKKIMINTAIDELRKNRMIPEIGGIDNTLWEISDRNDNADSLLLYKDLVILIKQLPPLYRAVFNLYVIDGYTHVQIAETLNMPIGTSKSCLSRAKALLQDQLNKMESGKSCSI